MTSSAAHAVAGALLDRGAGDADLGEHLGGAARRVDRQLQLVAR